MPPTGSPNKSAFFLSSSDKVRLRKLAPFFDIEFLQVDEETYSFCTFEGVRGCELSLPAAIAPEGFSLKLARGPLNGSIFTSALHVEIHC